MSTTTKSPAKGYTSHPAWRERVADLYRCGYSIGEIAEIVGAPKGTVSCQLSLMRRDGVDIGLRRPPGTKANGNRNGNGHHVVTAAAPTALGRIIASMIQREEELTASITAMEQERARISAARKAMTTGVGSAA